MAGLRKKMVGLAQNAGEPDEMVQKTNGADQEFQEISEPVQSKKTNKENIKAF